MHACPGILAYSGYVYLVAFERPFNSTMNYCIRYIVLFVSSQILYICEYLRSLAHYNCVNFNQAALRGVLKQEKMSSSTQARQISVCFVCVLCFSCCLDHCFRSFHTVWIYFNWLQNTGAKLFCIWNFLSASFFCLFICCLFSASEGWYVYTECVHWRYMLYIQFYFTVSFYITVLFESEIQNA